MDSLLKLSFLMIVLFAMTATSRLIRETENKDKYRLEVIARPISYDINLKPELQLTDNSSLKFDGHVVIKVQIVEKTNYIKLHSRDLDYGPNPENNAIKVTKENGTSIEVLNIDWTLKYMDFMIINLKQNLNANENIIITANYTSKLSNDMHGFYISEYTNAKKEKRFIAATQLQPTHARRVFPSFDEPSFKAQYTITLEKRKEYVATYSNMLQVTSNGDGSKASEFETIKFETTQTMSTYLVAFIISDFKIKENTKKDYGIIYRDSAENQINYAYSVGEPLLNSMIAYTTVPFDYKTHLVAMPDFSAGAMENWGLVTFREASLLYDENESTDINKQRIVSVIAHELAHMWFGDMITLDWWSNTWLNEGFARYFQYHLAAQVETKMDLEKQFVIEQIQNVFLDDALESSKPMSNEDIFTPEDIKDHFGSISYDKGASVIRMTEHALGSETFQNGLRNYLKKNLLGNTTPQLLFDALQDEENKKENKTNVAEFMKTWTEKPGYPVINVTLGDNKVILSQERYYFQKPSTPNAHKWKIPLTYTTDKELNFDSTAPKAWLEPADVKKEISGDFDWIIFNIQEVGFYRVFYDKPLLDRLTTYLYGINFTKVHELNRAQIVDDTMNLARAGYVTYDDALKLFEYLRNETNFYPWASAFNTISFMNRRMQGDSENLKTFQSYISMLMDKLNKNLGMQENSKDDHITKLNRVNSLSWGCKFGREDCVKMAEESFAKYMNGIKVPPNLRSAVYCTALRNGNDTHWNYLWNEYEKANVASEKVTMLTSLGCTKNENTLKNYLQKSITPGSGIRSQDANYVFTSVYSGNPSGIKVANDFLIKEYKNIEKMYGGVSELGKCIKGLSKQLTTKKDIDNLEKNLKTIVADYPTLEQLSKEVIAASRTDLEWNTKYEKVIISHIKGTRGSGTSLMYHIILLGVSIILAVNNF